MDIRDVLQVFVAEDNSADVYMVRAALHQAGLEFEIHLARDGDEALKLIARFGDDLPCPHIALIDLNLPRQDGAVILDRWRDQPACSGAPIVILTSSAAPDDRSLAARHGAVFFRKPFDMDEYLQIGNVVKQLCRPS